MRGNGGTYVKQRKNLVVQMPFKPQGGGTQGFGRAREGGRGQEGEAAYSLRAGAAWEACNVKF